MQNPKKILITGGSGLLGTRLTALLQNRGHSVSHLGRTKNSRGIETFLWNIDKHFIDRKAFDGIHSIIHLAGAGVSDKRWTAKRKSEILNSRTKSTRLLKEYLEMSTTPIESFVAASGTDYYGSRINEEEFVETDKPASDDKNFLCQVTGAWENEADLIADTGLRVVKIRIGFVLSDQGGALPKLSLPVKLLAGSPFGSGKQYVNWIHIDDLCRMFIKAVEDPLMKGAYNGVGPYAVTNKTLMEAIAAALNRPLLLPNLPGVVVRIIVGEMAETVLKGSKVSSRKIQDAGFTFEYKTLEDALRNLLCKPRENRRILQMLV